MSYKNRSNYKRLEVILWSLALPGFGQLLNGKYFKGAVLLIIEFLINIKSNLNLVIISSFKGDIVSSIGTVDFQWLMFYPCVYMFALWDAFRDSAAESAPFSFLPFALAAYLGTIGVIYSSQFVFWGVLLGPVWLPIIFMLIGTGIGLILMHMLVRKS